MQRCGTLCGSDIRSRIFAPHTSFDAVGFVRDKRGLEIPWSSDPEANSLSQHLHIYVLDMNLAPQVSWIVSFCHTFHDSNDSSQIGSRVRWWDSRGQLKHGHVKAINVLADVRSWTGLLSTGAEMLCD